MRILLGTNGLILLSSAMLAPIYAIFVEEVGGSILDAGMAAAVFALAAGITTLLIGRFADSIRESELVVVVGYGIIAAAFLGFTFVQSVAALLLVQILFGIGEAVYSPAFDGVYSKHIWDGNESTAWGLWESMNYFIGAGGAALGAFVVSIFGFSDTFLQHVRAKLCKCAVHLLTSAKDSLVN